MPEPREVSADEILESTGSVHERTFLQRTGLKLAAFVGAVGAFVIVWIVVSAIITVPRAPAIPPDMDQAKAKAIIDNYRELQQAALQPLATWFDVIVVKVLLPVFTSILGFIFGRASANS